jgi:sterol 3beta-glucosyltransferase
VVVPFHGDQPFWARRVHAGGTGPAPLPRTRLTAASLAAALREATSDAGLRTRAAALGEQIRAEDGVGRAVAAITRLARR